MHSAASICRLKGRRLTTREPELLSSSGLLGSNTVAVEGDDGDASGEDAALDGALDAQVRPAGVPTPVAFTRELSGLYWLDSICVMLSLGHMGLLSGAPMLSAACVATAFLLAARRTSHGSEPAPTNEVTALQTAAAAGQGLDMATWDRAMAEARAPSSEAASR